MLIKVRNDVHGLSTGINSKEIARTSRMISRMTGYVVQPNKAIVGKNAFAHESGIHQDGVLKERSTFEIMDATEVGLDSNSIVLGKHSGRHALKDALEQLGFTVDGAALNQAFKRFKEIADKKSQVTALDLEAIVSDEMREREESHELSWFEVESGSEREPKARVAVKMPSGEDQVGEASGDGPVDSIFSAIQKATGADAELREYHVAAVTGGDDALGSVTVMLRDGRPHRYRAGSGDGHPRGLGPRLREGAVKPPGRSGHQRGGGSDGRSGIGDDRARRRGLVLCGGHHPQCCDYTCNLGMWSLVLNHIQP